MLMLDISIHALVKRATLPRHLPRLGGKNFNPRPREEGDGLLDLVSSGENISIHALVKRATTPGGARATCAFHFNPRPREEGDCSVYA